LDIGFLEAGRLSGEEGLRAGRFSFCDWDMLVFVSFFPDSSAPAQGAYRIVLQSAVS
jgi:hypothetical protein